MRDWSKKNSLNLDSKMPNLIGVPSTDKIQFFSEFPKYGEFRQRNVFIVGDLEGQLMLAAIKGDKFSPEGLEDGDLVTQEYLFRMHHMGDPEARDFQKGTEIVASLGYRVW